MSNTTVTINERAFAESIEFALAAVWKWLIVEMKKNTPRDLDRLPVNVLDRKDWQVPRRNVHKWNKHRYKKPVQIFWHWYQWVSWNLWRSLAFEVDMKNYTVSWGVSSQWSAKKYAKYLEWDPWTPEKKWIRPFISYTIDDPEVQKRLVKVFETAFYNYIQKFND